MERCKGGSLKLFIWKIRGHNCFVVPIRISIVYIFESTFLHNLYLKHTRKNYVFQIPTSKKKLLCLSFL